MKPEQIDALRWFLTKAIEVSNVGRLRTSLGDGAHRRWALRQILHLIEPHHAALADALARAMTPRAGRLVRHDDPDTPVTGTLQAMDDDVVITTASHMPDGLIAVEHLGATRIWWDGQPIARNADGLMIFIDEDGREVLQDQVALRLDDGPLVFPLRFRTSL
jgi:hypothetical protein